MEGNLTKSRFHTKTNKHDMSQIREIAGPDAPRLTIVPIKTRLPDREVAAIRPLNLARISADATSCRVTPTGGVTLDDTLTLQA